MRMLKLLGFQVPFGIPFIAKKMAESSKYDAVIALGTVIRGSTYPL